MKGKVSMAKGINIGKVDEFVTKNLRTNTRQSFEEAVEKVVSSPKREGVKSVEELSAENIKANYGPIDSPMLSRFKPQIGGLPTKMPTQEELTKYIQQNAPKTKEEALARLDEIAKRENLPEDIIQALKEQIEKKFGK